MAKNTTSTSAAGGSTAAPAAPGAQAQGASAASVSPVVPGAPSAGKSAATPTPRSSDPDRPSIPVQIGDGVADYEARVLAALTNESDTPDTPAKAAPKKKAAPMQTVDDDDEDEPGDTGDEPNETDAQDQAPDLDAYDPDAPILGDAAADDEDADPDADGEADADTAAKASKLKKDNFKLREERRELREQLATAQAELKATREATVTHGGLPEFSGYYTGVKTPDDVKTAVAKIDADLDFLEDNLDGYTFEDAQGNTVEVTASEAKAYRRQAREAKRWADEIKQLITTHTERATTSEVTARKKYPFVFDAKSPHNARVLNLAKEHPSLAKDPARALALGRMVIGKLVESGEYQLVKRGKPLVKAADLPAPAPRRAPAPASPSATAGPHLQQEVTKDDLEALAMNLFQSVS
jgi:hypothetical protein